MTTAQSDFSGSGFKSTMLATVKGHEQTLPAELVMEVPKATDVRVTTGQVQESDIIQQKSEKKTNWLRVILIFLAAYLVLRMFFWQ